MLNCLNVKIIKFKEDKLVKNLICESRIQRKRM